MKQALLYSALLAFGVLHGEETSNLPDESFIAAPMIMPIPGTSLQQLETLTRPSNGEAKDWVTCEFVIGYERKLEGKEHGINARFVRILELPALANHDRYTVTVAAGVLRVSTEKGKREVAALHLANYCPALVTSEIEQPGAGQPATKAADKVPTDAKPPPPTSKVAPR